MIEKDRYSLLYEVKRILNLNIFSEQLNYMIDSVARFSLIRKKRYNVMNGKELYHLLR